MNLTQCTPKEIGRRMLETLTSKKLVAKAAAKRRREEAKGDAAVD